MLRTGALRDGMGREVGGGSGWGTHVHHSTVYIAASTWKQPRCPSADKWIRKLWYIYTMEYYSAIKKKEFI